MSHIYREGNVSGDRLANIVLSLTSFQYYHILPIEIREVYAHNRLGLPSYSFACEGFRLFPLLLFVTIFFYRF